jgi:hypothetical protein
LDLLLGRLAPAQELVTFLLKSLELTVPLGQLQPTGAQLFTEPDELHPVRLNLFTHGAGSIGSRAGVDPGCPWAAVTPK